MNFLFVALGGAIGALLRYAISLMPYKGDFPIPTLVTNAAGAFLIGIISGLAVKKGVSDNTVLFLKTGVCGGFTTFSTFSLEAYTLFKANHTMLAMVYIILSVSLCILGVLSGMYVSNGKL